MRVRIATPDDALAVAQVRVGTWRTAYAGLVPDEVLDRLDAGAEEPGHRARLQLVGDRGGREFVAEVDGEIVGWAAAGPSSDDDTVGELFAIYVLADQWGTGVGHALLAEAESFLRDAGFAHAVLWVLDGNARAAAFYEAHGWREDGASKTDDRFSGPSGWVAVERHRVRTLRD